MLFAAKLFAAEGIDAKNACIGSIYTGNIWAKSICASNSYAKGTCIKNISSAVGVSIKDVGPNGIGMESANTESAYTRGACINNVSAVEYLKTHLQSFQNLKI